MGKQPGITVCNERREDEDEHTSSPGKEPSIPKQTQTEQTITKTSRGGIEPKIGIALDRLKDPLLDLLTSAVLANMSENDTSAWMVGHELANVVDLVIDDHQERGIGIVLALV